MFLQQLGRGLRRSDRKSCLTVLDFIGGAHRRFRFDQRYRAILGGTRRALERTIESEFPLLPSGCSIQLDKHAQEMVLANLRAQLGTASSALIEDLRQLAKDRGADVGLATFLAEAGVDLEDVYTSQRGWTSLRRAAGLEPHLPTATEESMERSLTRMLHLDDDMRLHGIRSFLGHPSPPAPDPSDPVQRLLFVTLGFHRRTYAELGEAWRAMWSHPSLRGELNQLLIVLEDRVRYQTQPLTGSCLQVHGTYSLDEVLAAFDERGAHGGLKRIQTGVFPSKKADLLFVTLEKSENDYSPTTLYKDYALSPTRFHWESQSHCHPDTPTGKRHLDTRRGCNRALLFVRPRRQDARGVTMPYVCLGDVFCTSSRGERPKQIEWELAVPMPARLYQESKIAAG